MSEPSPTPDCLLLVRSTLEMAALIKRIHPDFAALVTSIEVEVQRAGQMLLDAGSIPRARTALETIHRARRELGQLDLPQTQGRYAA